MFVGLEPKSVSFSPKHVGVNKWQGFMMRVMEMIEDSESNQRQQEIIEIRVVEIELWIFEVECGWRGLLGQVDQHVRVPF